MAYATWNDVQARMNRTLSESEQSTCSVLLDDAAVMIDTYNVNASADAKKVVSCRMVSRALSNDAIDVPIGATQGSMSGLGYSQSWTMGTGASGELYLSKTDKTLLGVGNKIGSHSPLQDLVQGGEQP
ncbi:MAG: hypothetical protein IIZ78_28985 [Clostridiales bacterium]|jgi:hypothetical protein|nr:hypothetical protein [Clostridiales bacterium]